MAVEIQSLDTAKEVGHTVVDVEGLVNSMKEKLGSISESPPLFHICRVPAHIRKDNHVYYNPKIVSIGPFHRQRRNVRAMEEHKWRYLHKVLHRGLEPYEVLLKTCVEKMKNMEEEVRKCYSGSMLNMGKDEFVKMMLLDGCFVIQILLSHDQPEENDPIKNNEWMMPLIAEDMLLLENQLPFSVLTCLANLIDQTTVLKRRAIEFLFPALLDNFDQRTKNESPEHGTRLPEQETDIHHLLHLVHWSLEPAHPSNAKPFCAQLLQAVWKILSFQSRRGLANNNNEYQSLPDQGQEAGASFITVQPQEDGPSSITEQPQETGASSIPLNSIPTATELEEAGVVFKRKKEGSLLDVTFKNGVMRLPRLQIDDKTGSLFRNLIAFEQCFPDSRGVFTSYCFFMDSLVSTRGDVQILKQSDIIENLLGSDKEVALLFNQLCKEIAGDFGEDSVGKACKDVKDYAETRWHKWRARLMHDYFSNPWAIISLIAAVYVIFLTSVSTYYTVF